MDGLLDAVSEVIKLESDVNTKTKIVDNLKSMLVRFKDLRVYRTNSKSKYDFIMCCDEVNELVDSVGFTESSDGNVYAWPYAMFGDQQVYSTPPWYLIGIPNNNGFGIKPIEGIEASLESDGLPIKIILKIRQHLASKPPIDYMVG